MNDTSKQSETYENSHHILGKVRTKFDNEKVNTASLSTKLKDRNFYFCILAYIPFFWFIPILFADENNEFIRFHIKQGIRLTVTYVLLLLSVYAISTILLSITFKIVFLTSLLFILTNILLIMYIIIGIYNVFVCRMKILPVIGNRFNFLKLNR